MTTCRAAAAVWAPAVWPSLDPEPCSEDWLRFGPWTAGIRDTDPVPTPAESPRPLRISGCASAPLPVAVARSDVVPPAEIMRVPPLLVAAAPAGATVTALARTARTAEDVKNRCLNKVSSFPGLRGPSGRSGE